MRVACGKRLDQWIHDHVDLLASGFCLGNFKKTLTPHSRRVPAKKSDELECAKCLANFRGEVIESKEREILELSKKLKTAQQDQDLRELCYVEAKNATELVKKMQKVRAMSCRTLRGQERRIPYRPRPGPFELEPDRISLTLMRNPGE